MTFSLDEIRHACRALGRRPGFTAVAVLTLGLGIGANTAIFSVVNAVLFQPLPYPQPDRLVAIKGTNLTSPGDQFALLNYPDFLDLKSQAEGFEDLAAVAHRTVSMTGTDEPRRVSLGAVSESFFSVLGIQPVQGRGFLPKQQRAPEAPPAVVLSYGLWQSAFGGEDIWLGRTIRLGERDFVVTGILPKEFRPPSREVQLWVLLDQSAGLIPVPLLGHRGFRWLEAVGRLKEGVTLEQAQAQLDTIGRRLAQQHPSSNQGRGFRSVRLHESVVGNIRPALLILFGAVGFVLLIVCANVANLSLVRAAERGREMAVRAALGATPGRLVRHVLTESVVLALVGGGLGLLLAQWGVDALLWLSPQDLPRQQEIGIDGWVLGFTTGTALLTGLLFGLLPARQSSRVHLMEALKVGSQRTTRGGGWKVVRNLLVVTQLAGALVLLIGAGLLLNSFVRLTSVELGFNPERVLSLKMSLPSGRYSSPGQRVAFYRQVQERIGQLPGVQEVALGSGAPLTGFHSRGMLRVTSPSSSGRKEESLVYARAVSPGYFRLLQISQTRGRVFTPSDTEESVPVAVINETLARRVFGSEDPLGKNLVYQFFGDTAWKVVGVVSDVRQLSQDSEVEPEFCIPYAQVSLRSMNLLVRAESDPLSLLILVREVIWSLDANLPLDVTTLRQALSRRVAGPRFYTVLLGSFSVIAFLLAAIGVYGVISYSVTQRTHEIGIRMALGAQRANILKMVLRQGMALALIGVGVGLGGAYALTWLLAKFLFEVTPTDPATFTGVSLLLAVVAMFACYVPARRATRVDPMVALRYE